MNSNRSASRLKAALAGAAIFFLGEFFFFRVVSDGVAGFFFGGKANLLGEEQKTNLFFFTYFIKDCYGYCTPVVVLQVLQV
jgi:hypothetical protein